MFDVSNLTTTIVPKSDQLNSEQLLSAPMTITVSDVRIGNSEQPLIIDFEGSGGRPYKPCKTMRKLLVFAWGEDGNKWIGRSMTLFNKPDVKFGGVSVGGIRISHLSHIESEIKVSLTSTRGKKEPHLIKPLLVAPKGVIERFNDAVNAFSQLGVTEKMIIDKIGIESSANATQIHLQWLVGAFAKIKSGESVSQVFSN